MRAPARGECLIHRDGTGDWLLFAAPRAVHTTQRLEEVAALVAHVAAQVDGQSAWAAGFISHEAAPAFDAKLEVHTGGTVPLVWFGRYGPPTVVPAAVLSRLAAGPAARQATHTPTGSMRGGPEAARATAVPAWRLSLTPVSATSSS